MTLSQNTACATLTALLSLSHAQAEDEENPKAHSEPRYQAQIDAFEADSTRATEYLRPQYHFTPIAGFFNDPNGLAWFDGRWEYFYQHNGWGHAVSDDLVFWEHRIPVARPDRKGHIWSGGGVVDHKDVTGLFDGKPGYVGFFTYKNDREGNRQSQAIVYSRDGETFYKYAKNPVVPQLRHIEGQPDDPKFRDPKVFWHEPTQRWVMCVAGGLVRFFSSENLIDWKFESVNEDINTECPDLFQLAVDGDPSKKEWVLNGGGTFYQLGDFDGKKFTPKGNRLPISGGRDYYASQTFENTPGGRRIMSTWFFNWSNKGWPGRRGGTMTLPVELSLKSTPEGPRLMQTPVKELQKLREETQSFQTKATNSAEELPFATQAAEIEVSLKPKDAKKAGLHVFTGPQGDHTIIGYDAERGDLFMDASNCAYPIGNMWQRVHRIPVKLSAEGTLDLRIFLDWGAIEVFANGGLAYVNGLTAPQAASDGVKFFAEGGSASANLTVHSLKSIWRTEEDAAKGKTSVRMTPTINAPMGRDTVLSARTWPLSKAPGFQWKSADESIVSVNADPSNGEQALLTPKGFGRAKVTVTHPGGATAESLVLVQDPTKFRSNVEIKPLTSDWLFTGEGLQCDSNKRQFLYLAKQSPKVLETTITFQKDGKAGLLIHGLGRGGDGHLVEIDSKKDQVRVLTRKGRKENVFATEELKVEPGQPLKVRAQLSGRDPFSAKITINDQEVGTYPDQKPLVHWASDFGFFSQKGTITFNDFQLK